MPLSSNSLTVNPECRCSHGAFTVVTSNVIKVISVCEKHCSMLAAVTHTGEERKILHILRQENKGFQFVVVTVENNRIIADKLK